MSLGPLEIYVMICYYTDFLTWPKNVGLIFHDFFRVLLLYSKSHYSQMIFISDLVDRSVQLIPQQQGCAKQTDDTNSTLQIQHEFAGDARFQIFTQKWLLANISN